MEIKRLSNPHVKTATVAETEASGAAFARKLEGTGPAKAMEGGAAALVEKLLDRAGERMGGLPEGAREALRTQLLNDPYFQSRLERYRDKQGE